VLLTLTREQCESYLLPGGIGRVAFVVERGPVVLPVNFRFHGGNIVFRTASTASVSSALGTVMGFEVDRVDDTVSEGWSVLVTGRAEPAEAGERATLMRLGIEPWAGGYRDVFVRIGIDEITGRAIRQGRRSDFES
jgi:nitroimidazol reductase NimA-like FMN-containing flavoprotein (pyridoxamine 5'-phosphate oxidase superfamily)